MKTIFKNLPKISAIVLLLCIGYSCSKSKNDTADPSVITKPSLTAKIDSANYTLDAAALTSTYYTTDGDDAKALLATGRLNTTGGKIVFFINDFAEGTINLSKKAGTSLNPGNQHLKVNATAATPAVQTYVQYIKDGNTYYAASGTITIIIKNNATVTVTWNIKFIDASGRSFTSSGSFDLTNYQANPKPKSQIVDPTPVSIKPTIEGISPTIGFAGDTITITGVNYSSVLTDNIVNFNGVSGKVIAAIDTKIQVVSPPTGTTGIISLKIKNSETINGPVFTYLYPPIITSISPTSGKGGDVITIMGTNFGATTADNRVYFNGSNSAVIVTASTTKLTVKVPFDAATGKIRLIVTYGSRETQNNSGTTFTVNNLPTISYASPYNGRAGDIVNISGYFFAPNLTDNIVTFNGVQAKVVYASTTQLTVQVPQGASSGKILITVNGKTSADGYTFTIDAPYPNIQWQEIYSNSSAQNTNLMASLRNGLLFTGGLNPNYLYFSADDKTFTNVYNNLPFNKNKKLAIHLLSSDGAAFYVTSNLGVARSTDGVNWTKLVPDQNNPDIGFTGIVTTEGRVYLVSGTNLYTSENSGQTWTASQSTAPAPVDYFTSFSNNKYMFAADTSTNTTQHDATVFYYSPSKGASWVQAYHGVTGVYHFDTGYKDFLKASAYNVFCAYSPASSPALSNQRLYISKTQGAEWAKVSDELCYVVKTNNSYVGYGSSTFNLSTNDGTTFKSFALPAGYTLGGIEFGSFIYISAYNAAGAHKIFRSSY